MAVVVAVNNTPQWYLDLAGSSADAARLAIDEVSDYLDLAREKLVEAQHPSVDRLALCASWSFPAAGDPIHYKVTCDTVTKHGTSGFGVMSVCTGVVAHADKCIVIVGIDTAGMVRWWKYSGLRNVIVGLGHIVAAGQPIGDTASTLELETWMLNTQKMQIEIVEPLPFLARHGVPGIEVRDE